MIKIKKYNEKGTITYSCACPHCSCNTMLGQKLFGNTKKWSKCFICYKPTIGYDHTIMEVQRIRIKYHLEAKKENATQNHTI